MAKQISFALLLTKNVNLPILQLQQIETVIEVTGNTDSSTLQAMRDAVRDSFQARRNNLNKEIERWEKALAKEPSRRKREEGAKGAIKAIQKQVAGFEKDLTKRVQKFCREDTAKEAEMSREDLKWTVATVWSAATILKDTLSGIAAFFESAAWPPATLALAKSVCDLALDIKGLYGDLRDALKSEGDVCEDIQRTLKQIKKTKPPKTVAKSTLNNLEKSISLYSDKLDRVEYRAKAIAKRLDGLLKFAEKDGLSDAAQTALKTVNARLIKQVIKLNTDVKKGRRNYQSFSAKHKDASKRQANDAWAVVNWVLEAYDVVNKLFTWTVEIDDAEKQLDKLITLSTKDDFFAPIGG